MSKEPEFWNEYKPNVFDGSDHGVIVLYQGKNLGDVLLTTPVIEVLRQYSGSRIIVCTSQASRAIVDDPSRDINWVERQKRLPMIIASAFKIRKLSPKLFIDLHGSFDSSLFSFVLRAPTSIRMGGLSPRVLSFYNHSVPYRSESKRHRVDMHLDVLRHLGIPVVPSDRQVRALSLLKNLDENRKERLEKQFSMPYVLIHPVSRWLFKTPNPSFWLACINRLRERLNREIFLTGLASGREGKFLEYISHKTGVQMLGDLTLSELAFVMRGSSGYIGVDTFASHLASAFDVSGLVIFGPSDEASWGPLIGKLEVVANGDFTCRPCNLDGCGGGKRSDCLNAFSPSVIADRFVDLMNRQETA